MNYVVNKLQVQKNYVPESFDTDFIDYENKGFTAQVLRKRKSGRKRLL
jgi:hypothetical protein